MMKRWILISFHRGKIFFQLIKHKYDPLFLHNYIITYSFKVAMLKYLGKRTRKAVSFCSDPIRYLYCTELCLCIFVNRINIV